MHERKARNLKERRGTGRAARAGSVRRTMLPSGGWYELKYVHGCGPYLYFRYRDGSVRRTLYLGKAAPETVAWLRKYKRRRGRGARQTGDPA